MANLFDFASKNRKIEENNAEMNSEGFWNDQKHEGRPMDRSLKN